MEVEFDDDDLRRLLEEERFHARLPYEIVRMYRRRMQYILAAPDERAFRAMKSLHFEELEGDRKGQHSIRLNRRYRLIFRIEGEKSNKKIVLLSIEDYH